MIFCKEKRREGIFDVNICLCERKNMREWKYSYNYWECISFWGLLPIIGLTMVAMRCHRWLSVLEWMALGWV